MAPDWEEVDEFAKLMKQKLDENSHKPGWKKDRPVTLIGRLSEEMRELERAFDMYSTLPTIFANRAEIKAAFKEEIRREAADVANFAMMVADRMKDVDT